MVAKEQVKVGESRPASCQSTLQAMAGDNNRERWGKSYSCFPES